MIKIQGIYKIVNKINNKVYVGQSINIYKRFNYHKNGVKNYLNYPLYKAFKKYGIYNFEFVILEKVDNILLLDTREQFWMDFYNSYNPDYGYNIYREAATPRGYKHSEESRKRNSESNKGKIISKETRLKLSLFRKGKKLSKETKNKLSELHIGKKHSDESKEKISKNSKEMWVDPKYRINMVNKCKQRWQDNKYREMMLKARRDKKISKYKQNKDNIINFKQAI